MLIGAARRLRTGRAIGIDLWRTEDLGGNSPAGARANAAIEGVADRVTFETADMRALPLATRALTWCCRRPRSTTSSRLPAAGRRSRRWLECSAGGTVLFADIRHIDEYAGVLRELGLTAGSRGRWSAGGCSPWSRSARCVRACCAADERKSLSGSASSMLPLELCRRLTNGLYVVGVAHGEQRDGFTAAWVTQVSFDPLLVALSINPSHASFPMLVAAEAFAVSILGHGQLELARHFGTQSGWAVDKLAGQRWQPARGARRCCWMRWPIWNAGLSAVTPPAITSSCWGRWRGAGARA